MTFLETISGLKLERLTSAVLQYLFVNSEAFRTKFVDCISRQFSKSLVPRFDSGIRCKCEVGNKTDGFIDVCLAADNCILAIENKLWASFQRNQPAKYERIVENEAERHQLPAKNCRTVIIAPKFRATEIKTHLDTQEFNDKCIVVYWDQIQEILKSLVGFENAKLTAVALFLDEYIDAIVGGHAEMEFPSEKLVGNVGMRNQYQEDFLYEIKSTFSEFDCTRLRFGRSYGGFYFTKNDDKHNNWFGFHQRGNNIGLECHCTLEEAQVTSPDELKTKGWSLKQHEQGERPFYFAFAPDKWPADRKAWDDAIQPILEIVSKYTDTTQKTDEDAPPEGSDT